MSNHFGKCWLPLHQEAVTQLWRTPCCVRVRSFSDMFNIFVVLSGLIILPKLFIQRFRVYGTTLCNLWLFPNCLPRDVWYRIGHFSKYVSVYSSEILLRRPKCVSIASALLRSGSSTRLYVFRLTRKTWDIGKEYVGLRYGHVYVSIMLTWMRSALLCNITQRRVVILYRRFGETCRLYLQESRKNYLTLG